MHSVARLHKAIDVVFGQAERLAQRKALLGNVFSESFGGGCHSCSDVLINHRAFLIREDQWFDVLLASVPVRFGSGVVYV
jgi:hypothetical protein